MGKGDKKSRRGKITIGSYGKTRPKNKPKGIIKTAEKVTVAAAEPAAAKKPAAKKAAAEPKKAAEKKTTKKKEG